MLTIIEILAAAAAAAASPTTQDCRTIADPNTRLACYDAQNGAPLAKSAPARSSTISASPAPSMSPSVEAAARPPRLAPSSGNDAPATAAQIVRADPTGHIVAVTPLRHGLFRIQLDDGRRFNTTSDMTPPPEVGDMISLRRTALGTTFLDVHGRRSITVRLQRDYR